MPSLLPTGRTGRFSARSRRKLWREVHFWLGLVAGTTLVVIGLTGSLLVYFKEIDAWLNPHLHVVAAPPAGRAAYRPISEIVAAARAAIPAGAQLGFTYYPRNEETAYWFWYSSPKGSQAGGEGGTDTMNVFVNPYTAQVTGTRVWYSAESPFKNCLMGFIFKLHYALLLGAPGNTLVGILCVFFIISSLTGLILWWPITGKWRQAFLFKKHASSERLNHDLHKLSGFYSLVVLLAVLVSGVYFNLGPQFLWLVELFAPVTQRLDIVGKQQAHGTTISIDRVEEIVHQRFPDGQWFAFSLPPQTSAMPDNRPLPYRVAQLVPSAWGFVGRREIIVDQYSGEILHVGDPFRGRGGDVFIQWQWPLHSGYALGMPGRILVLIAGIVGAVLYVTGVIRWLQKRRARRLAERRRCALPIPANEARS